MLQCRGHKTLDINAFACTYKAPGQHAACGHRRCNDCSVSFDGSVDKVGVFVTLKDTWDVRDYPGGTHLKIRLMEDFGNAFREKIGL